jgi:hypothetical protein
MIIMGIERRTEMAKTRKKGKMKRAYLKRWGAAVVNTGQGPSKEGMEILYYNHVKALGKPEPSSIFKGIPAGRVDVIDRLVQILGEIPPERHVKLIDSKAIELKLFFNDKHDRWFFLYRRGKLVQQSTIYSCKAYALAAYERGSIYWLDSFIQD